MKSEVATNENKLVENGGESQSAIPEENWFGEAGISARSRSGGIQTVLWREFEFMNGGGLK